MGPGRFGSDGQIEFPVDDDAEPQYLSDLKPAPDDVDQQTGAAEAASAPPAGTATEPTVVLDDTATDEAEPDAAPRGRRPRAGRRRRMPLSRRLAVLGGADGDILDDVPAETPRFVQMFFVLLGTAVVSALSMFFALLTGVQVIVWIAVPLAIVWALIIFNLDRFLTSTMTSTRNPWRLLGLAFPRVVMAALIGIVVAEPLVLQIFQNDITREMNATNVVQALEDQTAVTDGPEAQALDAAGERLAELENQAATGIIAGTSSTSAEAAAAQTTVDQLTAQLAEKQAVIDEARLLYQCELTGAGAGEVEGCSGVTGEGSSSEAAEAQLSAAQAAYDETAAQLLEAQNALTAANGASADAAASASEINKQQAEDELPVAREQYDMALAAYNEQAESVASGNAGATGLLSQMSAMERLAEQEPAIRWAHLLIAGLFFMIELLPVIVKVLTSYGDPWPCVARSISTASPRARGPSAHPSRPPGPGSQLQRGCRSGRTPDGGEAGTPVGGALDLVDDRQRQVGGGDGRGSVGVLEENVAAEHVRPARGRAEPGAEVRRRADVEPVDRLRGPFKDVEGAQTRLDLGLDFGGEVLVGDVPECAPALFELQRRCPADVAHARRGAGDLVQEALQHILDLARHVTAGRQGHHDGVASLHDARQGLRVARVSGHVVDPLGRGIGSRAADRRDLVSAARRLSGHRRSSVSAAAENRDACHEYRPFPRPPSARTPQLTPWATPSAASRIPHGPGAGRRGSARVAAGRRGSAGVGAGRRGSPRVGGGRRGSAGVAAGRRGSARVG